MYVSQLHTRSGESRPHSWLTPERLVVYSGAMLVLYVVFLAVWAWASHGFSISGFTRPGFDFSIFWSASYALLHGSAWQVYDHFTFEKIELMLFDDFRHGNFMPWLYPPTFLLLVAPFALLPPIAMYFLFIGISIYLFSVGTLRVSGLAGSFSNSRLGWLVVAASPCVFVPALFGQNSLLTAAFAALAIHWLGRHPVRAGLCIGLLAIKPQMALLVPLVLIAGRAWRTIAVAALSAALFGAVSVLVCGVQSLRMFAVNSGVARYLLLEHGTHYWHASPTTFAVLREGGASLAAAYAGEACVALVATVAAYHVWRATQDTRLRAAVLVVATLLANPYVWHYELAWLGIAMACLTALGLKKGWQRGEQAVLALAWLLPVYEFFNRVAAWPQIGPIVLLLMLLIILRRVRIVEGVTP